MSARRSVAAAMTMAVICIDAPKRLFVQLSRASPPCSFFLNKNQNLRRDVEEACFGPG